MPSAQPERKSGKWIKGANHGLGVYTLTCDKCGYVDVSSNVINYCPNCGAKMEGETHD
jgi:rubrerythrin